MGNRGPRYVIVSPVRNERVYIRETLVSVARQSLLPLRWIIVDDGSTDGTAEVLRDFSNRLAWITLLRLPGSSTRRQGGAPVMRAFAAGLDLLRDTDFDFIVKLDCDVCLPVSYFAVLLNRFTQDEKLGIASGTYLEQSKDGQWMPVAMPDYHAAGASKVIRAECFTDIHGFVPSRGWDTVDEIRARARGWNTGHFRDIQFRHLKPEGSGTGYLRTAVMLGEIDYLTGAGVVFVALKALRRAITGKPPIAGGLTLLASYCKSRLRRRPRLVSDAEAWQYRHLLNTRMIAGVRGMASHLVKRARGNV